MALKDFLDHKATIVERQATVSGGEEIFTDVAVYTNIPCYYYKTTQSLRNTEIARDTTGGSLKVIVDKTRKNIRSGQIITINDEFLGDLGTFKIENPRPYKFISKGIDSFVFNLSPIKGGN